MPLDLDYIKRINNCYNTTTKQESDLYELKKNVSDGFEDTIDFHNVTIDNSITKQGLLIVHDFTKSYNKKIKSRPNETFNLGSIVNWDESNWLIYDVDNDKQIYTRGQMEQCNYTLPFQDTDGTILKYPCYIEEISSQGIIDGKTISTPIQKYNLSLKFDEKTQLLDIDRRFLIDIILGNVVKTKVPAYKVVKRDVITNNDKNSGGVLRLQVEYCAFGDTDNIENMICDYFTPSAPQSSTTCQITYTGQSPIIYIGGKIKTFTAIFKDNLGNIITTPIAEWTVNTPLSDQSKILFKVDTINPNICTLQATKDFKLLPVKNPTNNIVRLSLTDTTGVYQTFVDVIIQYIL